MGERSIQVNARDSRRLATELERLGVVQVSVCPTWVDLWVFGLSDQARYQCVEEKLFRKGLSRARCSRKQYLFQVSLQAEAIDHYAGKKSGVQW